MMQLFKEFYLKDSMVYSVNVAFLVLILANTLKIVVCMV